MCRFLLVLTATLYLLFTITEGGQICYECNSKEGSCSYDSMEGTREGACARGYDVCAVYKKVPPNGTVQLVRYCDDWPCKNFHDTWETGKDQKTKHCRLCCSDNALCNNFNVDPCNPSKAGRLEFQTVAGTLSAIITVFINSYSL